MSRIIIEPNGMAYYERMQESGCKVEVVDTDTLTIIRENEKIPFQIDKGEFMRSFIIPSKESTVLLLMAHHLVGDGKSIAYFLEDVMRSLNKEQLSFKPMRLITLQDFNKDSKLSFGIKLFIHSMNRKWKRSGKIFNFDDYYKIHNTYWQSHESNYISYHFTKDEFLKVKSNAKRAGVSINTYIIIAFLRADPNIHGVGIPVGMRDKDRSMSNQTTGIEVKYRYSQDKTFNENMKALQHKIYKVLDNPKHRYFVLQFVGKLTPSLYDSELLSTYGCYDNSVSAYMANISGYTGDKMRGFGVTNLTKLDIASQYGEYKINNIEFIPPAISYSKNNIGVVTLDDTMVISYHIMNTQDQNQCKKFFEQGIKFIKMN